MARPIVLRLTKPFCGYVLPLSRTISQLNQQIPRISSMLPAPSLTGVSLAGLLLFIPWSVREQIYKEIIDELHIWEKSYWKKEILIHSIFLSLNEKKENTALSEFNGLRSRTAFTDEPKLYPGPVRRCFSCTIHSSMGCHRSAGKRKNTEILRTSTGTTDQRTCTTLLKMDFASSSVRVVLIWM